MVIMAVLIIVLLVFLGINWKTRNTNAYKNFYRAIHVVKDVPKGKKYRIAAFGSTFAYYAYDLKNYAGHNFSVEPQSIRYMKKTIKHFAGNIEKGGIALISLTGCFFAASSTVSDEECLTYQSFLPQDEFDRYNKKTKIKYYLKRYLPALSLYYVKCNIRDEQLKYSVEEKISYEQGLRQASVRIKGWEKVVGKSIADDFDVDDILKQKIDENVQIMRSILTDLRKEDIIPVFVVLPMSAAFNEACPKRFYDAILYKCLERLKDENVLAVDFLYSEEMKEMDYYLTADCLNAKGRKIFTQKLMNAIRNSQELLESGFTRMEHGNENCR